MALDLDALPHEARELLARFPEFEPNHFNDTGANGYVLLGRHNILQREVALKIYFHAPNELDQEPALVAALNHANVMKVLDARNLRPDCSFFMTPFANYGDLGTYLKDNHLSLPLAFRLLVQLLAGLSALHGDPNRLLHRDLKPQNLLVHNDTILIADFGSVRHLANGNDTVSASKHSVLYRPPEAFGDTGYFNFSSDCYQAGIIGYLLFGGALSEDLPDHLKPAEKRQLDQLKYENVAWYQECEFVDQCIRARIEKGTLLNWASIPEFVPRRIIRALKRATGKKNRYRDVSEFLAQLASPEPLPDWIRESGHTCTLREWKGADYRLIEHNGQISVTKKRVNAAKFMRDNALSGGTWAQTLELLSQKLGIP